MTASKFADYQLRLRNLTLSAEIIIGSEMRFQQLALRLFTDSKGSVSLLFALIALLLFSFIGAAVDYSRWNNARSRTSDALDAALLTAGRSLQTAQSQESAIAAAEATFLQNAKTRLNLFAPKINVQVSADGSALEGKASGKMKTPFMGLLRYGALDVEATSRVGFGFGSGSGGSDLEISMMLDVTGSMCNDGTGPCSTSAKLDALKAAASDLVNIVKQGGSNGPNVRIAVVPFSTRVRVGAAQNAAAENLMTDLTDLAPRNSGWYKQWDNCTGGTVSSEDPDTGTCSTWTAQYMNGAVIIPCVTDRTGPDEFTDAPPGPGRWLNGADGTRRPIAWDSQGTPINPGDGTGASAADPSDLWDYNADGFCWDVEVPNIVMPLNADKDAVLQRINELVAYGSTGGALGTAWAWYTLSPAWSSIWPADSAPGPYEATGGSSPAPLRKIAVLMSDGLYNTHRGIKGSDPVMVSDNAKQICANMKAKGIEIYTVGFDLDSLPAADKARAIDTLQSCGSDIQHFYDALDTAQLTQSFRDIAMQLSQLYIAR